MPKRVRKPVTLQIRVVKAATAKEKPYDLYDDRTKGFLLRIEPTGSKTWYCRYRRHTGEWGRYRIGPVTRHTPDQARQKATAIIRDAEEGRGPDVPVKPDTPTLKAYLDGLYTRRWAIGAKEKSRKASISRMKASFADFLETPIDRISKAALADWQAAAVEAKKAPATINREIGSLKSALNHAIEWGLIEKNLVHDVKPIRFDRHPTPRYLGSKPGDAKEYGRLIKALEDRQETMRKERDSHRTWAADRGYSLEDWPDLRAVEYTDHLMPMVLVSLNTGLRRGELFNLTWTDVNLDGQYPALTVQGDTSKTSQTRTVPLNPMAREVLRKWQAQNAGAGLVFPSKDGRRFDNVNTSWAAVLDEAKITEFRWHDMRHHFASMLAIQGVPLNKIRQVLGHTDLKVTLRYAHLSPDSMAEVAVDLDHGLANVVQMKQTG